jgi:hypothetical protein
LTCDQETSEPGGAIRTISVSLLAAAAIAVSVFFAKTRQAHVAEEIQKSDAVEGSISLEAIRAAGI